MPVGGSLLLPFQIFVPDPLEDLGPISVDERFSTLLSTIAPQYVQNDHQKFITFVKAYFEYLEIHGNPRAEAVRLNSYTDVDRTLDDFVQYFKNNYLNNFPSGGFDTDADEKLAVKNSSAYYGEKGNARSIDYLFRLLFGTPAEIETPKDKLFKISDADYDPSVILYCSHYNGKEELSLFKGSQIQQRALDDFTSEVVTTALIDDITFHLDDGVEYAKLFLKEVRGVFRPNKYVEFYRANRNRLTIERTFPVVSNLSVTDKGSNYAVGDDIIVKDSAGKIVLTSQVESVNSLGEIEVISSSPRQNKIYFPGESYDISVGSASGQNAGFTLDGNISAAKNRNNFSSQRSLLSSDSFVQDNFKFQNFSYIIRAEKQIKDYAAIVRKIFHPAGSVMLAEFSSKNNFSGVKLAHKNYQDISFIDPVIGNFLPYTFGSTADFRGETMGITFQDFYPGGYNGLTGATVGDVNVFGIGITHDPFNAGTFLFGPVGGFTANGNNPEVHIGGGALPGYQRVELPQLTYITDPDKTAQGTVDSAFSEFYIISRHPKTFLTSNLEKAETSNFTAPNGPLSNFTAFNTSLIKDHRGNPQIIRKTVTLILDTNEGVSGTFTEGDIVRQKIPNSPEAIGEIVAVPSGAGIRTSGSGVNTSFYRKQSVAEIIKNFNAKRTRLDVGAEAEAEDQVVSSAVVSESGDSGLSLASAEDIEGLPVISYSDSSEATYASETRTVEVVEETLASGKKQLVAKTTIKTPQDIIKDDPKGKYQTSVSTSDVIDPQTLKPVTITVSMISGEFSNESDRNGNRFPIIGDSSGEGLLATGLNNDKSVKGTVAAVSESIDDIKFTDIVIGEFFDLLELPDF